MTMRGATILLIAIAGVLSVALFSVKYQVADLEGQLNEINRGIARDHQAIHVLRAEWSYLNDPKRLRELAQKFLKLEPVKGTQLETFATLPPPEPTTAAPAAGPAPTSNLKAQPVAVRPRVETTQ